MSNEIVKPTPKALLNSDQVKAKFNELLGKRSAAFITSILQVVNNSALLSKADPMTILHAATVAATLDLPINSNLGFAYIVPYKGQAQFQMGYKGFIQLALRSGQFHKISASEIYEGQIKSADPLKGYEFDFTKTGETVVGYAAYFRLVNGFEATYYMTVDQLKSHGKRFSQSFKGGGGLWKDDFHNMALKTVIKMLLSKWAPLSVEMIQHAVIVDQGVINNEDGTEITYIDNEDEKIDKELERATILMNETQSLESLREIWDSIGPDLQEKLAETMADRYQEIDRLLQTLKK